MVIRLGLKIIGMGKGIPSLSVSNDDLSAFLDTNDEWIRQRTGIESRFICTDETLTDLSVCAAGEAIKNAKLTADDIDLIICTTIMGEYRTPSLACCVAERIGAVCPAFDVNAACAGFVYALGTAEGFLSSGRYRNILIICAEMMSSHADFTDRNTCVLFGDGAAACVVTEGNALRYVNLKCIPNIEVLNLPVGNGNNPFAAVKKESGYLFMKGKEVFKFAVNIVEQEAMTAFEKLGISPADVDYYILHQANKRIIDSARNKLGLEESRFPVNINRYGNISSASIPILLCEMVEDGRIKKGDTLFVSAFGAGLTAGSVVLVWE